METSIFYRSAERQHAGGDTAGALKTCFRILNGDDLDDDLYYQAKTNLFVANNANVRDYPDLWRYCVEAMDLYNFLRKDEKYSGSAQDAFELIMEQIAGRMLEIHGMMEDGSPSKRRMEDTIRERYQTSREEEDSIKQDLYTSRNLPLKDEHSTQRPSSSIQSKRKHLLKLIDGLDDEGYNDAIKFLNDYAEKVKMRQELEQTLGPWRRDRRTLEQQINDLVQARLEALASKIYAELEIMTQ